LVRRETRSANLERERLVIELFPATLQTTDEQIYGPVSYEEARKFVDAASETSFEMNARFSSSVKIRID